MPKATTLLSKSPLRYLLGILAFLFVCSCTLPTSPPFTEDEKNWLGENKDRLEVLFGYEAPPTKTIYQKTIAGGGGTGY